jgi:hypothetical protein
LRREASWRTSKSAKYPIFLLGLVVIIVGDLVANAIGGGLTAEVTASTIGFLLLLTSVLLR